MTELRRLLDRGVELFEPVEDVVNAVARAERRQRRRRITVGAVALAVAAAGTTALIRPFQNTTPGIGPGASPAPTHAPTAEVATNVFHPADLHFWDEQHGIVVGSVGANRWSATCQPDCRAEVRETTDGGATWTTIHARPGDFGDLAAFGPSELWAQIETCAPGADCDLTVLRSSDRGRTWTEFSHGARLSSMTVTARDEAWAIRTFEGGNLTRTLDGGRRWLPVPSPCPADDPAATAVSFPTPDSGWVVCAGEAAAERQNKTLVHTTDAGSSWAVVARSATAARIAIGTGFDDVGYAGWAMWFDERGRGVLAAGESGPSVRTLDGGRSWTPLDLAEDHFTWLTSFSFAGDAEFATVSSRAASERYSSGVYLLRSDDGGETWGIVYSWPIEY
ncbi:MAG: hypothetical protein WD770_05045 [Actinomycetota bacterium]